MAALGRPSKYDPSFCEQARKLCLLGHTNDELAAFFEVDPSTIDKWIAEIPDFSGSVKEGREKADADVTETLYRRAMGYSHEDVHISNYQGEITKTPIVKHYPPETVAAIFWLKNRQRLKWRDRQDHELTGKDGGPIQTEELSELEIAKRIAFLLTKSQKE